MKSYSAQGQSTRLPVRFSVALEDGDALVLHAQPTGSVKPTCNMKQDESSL